NLPETAVHANAAGQRPPAELTRRLSLFDSIAIVVGIMIGGGIFLVPNLVARSLPQIPAILFAWVIAGAISFIGAMGCAGLGAALPATGGQYVFIREAYGAPSAFLCGWSLFTVGRSAQVAWMAVVFSIYISYWVPLSPVAAKLAGLAVLGLFMLANY